MLKKMVRRAAFRALNGLPAPYRQRIGRRLINLPATMPPGYVAKVAETASELRQALTLVHQAYLAEGFTRDHPSGMRLTKYHLLPTTTVIVLKEGDEVIATLSLIQDGPLGVPMDEAFDLAPLRAKGRRFAEVSALAAAPHRRQSPALHFLAKFLFHYSLQCLRLTDWVAAANPKHNYLYETLWMFEPLAAPPVASYAFAAGAPAVPWINDLETVLLRGYPEFRHLGPKQNMFTFFRDLVLSGCALPDPESPVAGLASIDPAVFRDLFTRDGSLALDLSTPDRAVLHELYRGTELAPLFADGSIEVIPRRRDRRHSVGWRAQVRAAGDDPIQVRVLDASRGGLKISSTVALVGGSTLEVTIAPTEWLIIHLTCRVVRNADDHTYGLGVLAAPSAFHERLAAMDGAWGSERPMRFKERKLTAA